LHGVHTGARSVDRPLHQGCRYRELNLEPAMSKGTVLMEAEMREAP